MVRVARLRIRLQLRVQVGDDDCGLAARACLRRHRSNDDASEGGSGRDRNRQHRGRGGGDWWSGLRVVYRRWRFGRPVAGSWRSGDWPWCVDRRLCRGIHRHRRRRGRLPLRDRWRRLWPRRHRWPTLRRSGACFRAPMDRRDPVRLPVTRQATRVSAVSPGAASAARPACRPPIDCPSAGGQHCRRSASRTVRRTAAARRCMSSRL